PLSFSPETLRRWWISGRRLPKCIADYSQARERRDRQALRSSPALRRAPKTLARRADLRLARARPQAVQGLGMCQRQGARLHRARFYSPHASKAMQSKTMFPDRLLVLYGLWTANYLTFEGDVCCDLAAHFLALAEKQEATVPRVIGHRIMGPSLTIRGDI